MRCFTEIHGETAIEALQAGSRSSHRRTKQPRWPQLDSRPRYHKHVARPMNGPDGGDSEMLPVVSRVNGGDMSLHGERERV